jgi:serine/threonine protein kinase
MPKTDSADHRLPEACGDSFEEHFLPLGVAGIGSFGIVFSATTKSKPHIEKFGTPQHREESDGRGTQAIQAVKLCLPGCPSGIKSSTVRLLAEIEAMKRVSQNRTESVRHLFAELYAYNTSNEPWYSMELILPGITLHQVFDVASAASHPVPEEIVFHVADQAARAFHFLHDDCSLVCTDIRQSNMTLRYPGREVAVMPDLVLIDWSFWAEASDTTTNCAVENLYHCLFPVFFDWGWRCGPHHDQDSCVASGVLHGCEWLDLQSRMGSRKSPLSAFSDSIQKTVKHMRRETMYNSGRADAFGHLLLASADISTAEKQEES